MTDELKIIIRAATLNDHGFIFSTWPQGAYYDVKKVLRPVWSEYFARERARIGEILSRTDTQIRIAGSLSDPLWIAGYAVSAGPSLHWMHVKKVFRCQGIATLLARDAGITQVLAVTRLGKEIADKKGLKFIPRNEDIDGRGKNGNAKAAENAR